MSVDQSGADARQSEAKALSIQELPRGERPRERLHGLGAQALSTVELVAIVLGAGSGVRSSLEVARAWLRCRSAAGAPCKGRRLRESRESEA